MILSFHIADIGAPRALKALRSRPDPAKIDGLRWAETWLTNPFRTGSLPRFLFGRSAMLAAWDDDDALDRFLGHRLARVYAGGWHVRLEPLRTIGAWPGLPDLPRQERPTAEGPVAVLTMARLRPARSPAFIRAAAAPEREALGHPGLIEGCGFLRPPGLVATFSLWRDAQQMRDYAAGSYPGGHARAVKQQDTHSFHHETVFTRMRPYGAEGQWNGRDPLAVSDALVRV
jgi:hypothetical protein